MRIVALAVACTVSYASCFVPISPTSCNRLITFPSTSLASSSTAPNAVTETALIDPKEAVKVFGRLAEKYIMLDSSGGLCCYSGCKDCEFRRPDGGYIMADQSAARPKWIPSYSSRVANGKEHISKWSSQLFQDGQTSLTKEEFCNQLVQLDYAPTLGGPFVSASSASISQDSAAAGALFDALADGKESLTKIRMSTRLKQLASGEEGLVWSAFSTALCGI